MSTNIYDLGRATNSKTSVFVMVLGVKQAAPLYLILFTLSSCTKCRLLSIETMSV